MYMVYVVQHAHVCIMYMCIEMHMCTHTYMSYHVHHVQMYLISVHLTDT